MVRCPKCGKMNQDSSRFCNQCGATLPQTRIRCPHCGTMNPIGNVFCSRCNTRLLSTEMKLPEKPKHVEEPPVGVKGISLPTLQTAKDGVLEPEELPDWLLELTEQSLGKPAEPSNAAEPAQADQFPDWLSGIVNASEDVFSTEEVPASASEETPGELSDWFSELVAGVETPGEAAPEETAASMAPDWFTDLLEDETAGVAEVEVKTVNGPTPVEEEPALEALPDWLSDLMPEEPAAIPAADTFDTALPPSPTWEAIAPAPDFAAIPRADLPDWLLSTAVPIPAGEVAVSQPMPKWLLENAEEPVPGQETGGQEIPVWLMKDAEPGTPVAPRVPASPRPTSVEVPVRARPAEVVPSPLFVEEPEEEAEGVPAVGVSDWLANLYPEEELAPQAVMPITERKEEPAEAMPDWLMGMYDEEEVEPQVAAPAVESVKEGASEAGVPDWLLGLYDEEEIEPQAAGPVVESEEEAVAPEAGVPDWLAGIYSEEEAEAPTAAFTTELEEEAGAPEAGVPDWLAGIYSEEEAEAPTIALTTEPEEEAVLGAGVPDWLAGIMAEEPVPAQPHVPSEEEAATLAAGVPDWLAGLAEAPSAGEEQPSPFAADRSIFTEAAPEEPLPTPSTTPEWLKGVTPVDEELALKPAQPAFIPGEGLSGAFEEETEEPVLEGGEIPDWLKGLSPAAPSSVEEEAAFLERVSEDESLVRAEVPSWLQGLRPPGTGPLPPLPEVMAPGAEVPQEGGLVRAEIPDWVQQLRPLPSAEGEAGEKRILEPAETEGPLAGLRGVLPAGALVDMPADFEPVPLSAIPDSIVTQAQLWQRLLEQPRSVRRPVAQHHVRSGSGQMAMRWIVTVALLVVTALGLLWSNAPLSQALSNAHTEQFSKAIDALQAGDTVIVAVEYGPAEAGEMTALAEAVVQHLADRNARVMMVSTLPEGAGLIHGLLEPLALANRLPADRVAYLPGSSSGVAQFLTGPSDAKMLIVLAGRVERLRWWVEQNNAKTTASAPPLPMNVAVNAATAPLAMPYLETSPVEGWIAGFSDVVAYQEFRGLTTSSVRNSELNALMLAHWAALALLFFGLFYYLALGKKGAS
jgi:hypothetical protein